MGSEKETGDGEEGCESENGRAIFHLFFEEEVTESEKANDSAFWR